MDEREGQHSSLEARITAIVEPSLQDMGFELVRVAVLGHDRPTVQIMVDRADGQNVSVADCEQVSYQVNALTNVDDPITGPWTLEVSSPGIDRPLTRLKDWNRFAGHLARVELVAAVDGRKRFSGIALGADESAARLRLDDGSEVSLPLPEVRRAKLVLTDALIEFTATPTKPN